MNYFTCIICALPKPVAEAHVGSDKFCTVCKHCFSKGLVERYLRMCPPAFLKTDANLLPDVAKKYLPDVMGWEYGAKGLLLWGHTSGTGKTRCMWLLVKRLMTMHSIPVVYFDCLGFGHQMERLYREGGDVSALRDSAVFAPVLWLDDIGKAPVTERASAELYWVIDKRVHDDLPILATTNETGDTLAGRMKPTHGDYAARRLREFSHQIQFDQ